MAGCRGSAMSYTPGPWKINKSKTRVWIEGTGRGCGVPRIAIVDDSAGTEPGNANLLASAPELLEALEWLNNEFDCRNSDYGGVLFSYEDFEKVRAAIKTARCEE